MDRVKQPLEKVGEWTTAHKRLNKVNTFKSINPNQGFVTIPSQVSFYPNQGYYIPYQMVRQSVGTQLSFTPQPVSPLPWSQDPNSAYQANYAEIIKGAVYASENLRIAYDIGVGYTQDDRNNESVQLLKKIADMEIDDFPSYIIEEIKNTWENWNSLRLSINSLHLDEIEKMNLDNIQER
ncbi:hypothetical protein Gotur_014555 [Gossypium turneri]